MLNMHPNTAFLATAQSSRRQHQMGWRNEMLPEIWLRGAKHNMNRGIWQMNDDVPERFRVIQTAAPDVMPLDVGPAQRTHT